MIEGPFTIDETDQRQTVVPLKRPYLTPKFRGKRVALRVSEADWAEVQGRGPGIRGTITDLDDGCVYTVIGRPCSLGEHCYCDAEIVRQEA